MKRAGPNGAGFFIFAIASRNWFCVESRFTRSRSGAGASRKAARATGARSAEGEILPPLPKNAPVLEEGRPFRCCYCGTRCPRSGARSAGNTLSCPHFTLRSTTAEGLSEVTHHSIPTEGDIIFRPLRRPVGCELIFKQRLVADTSHGSRDSIGNYSGEQYFDQC